MKIHNALASNLDKLGVVKSFFTINHCADSLFLTVPSTHWVKKLDKSKSFFTYENYK